MPTLEIIEVQQPPDSWTLKNGPAAGQEMHTYTLRAKGPDGEQTYQMNRKPTSGPPELGPGDYEITPPKPGTSFPPKIKKAYSGGGGGRSGAKDAYWEAKEQRDIVSQRRQGRAHAQEMGLRALVIEGVKQLNKDELLAWIDFFDQDTLSKGADVGGGPRQSGNAGAQPGFAAQPSPAADVSATTPQKRAITTLLNKAGVSKDFQRTIVLSFADPLTKAAASRILDVLNDEALGHPEGRVDALLRDAGLERPSDLPPPDERDLAAPEPVAVGAADDDIPF